MTQPPRAPLLPLQPMAPLQPMRPLVPLQPLQPGQRRGDQPAAAPQFQQTYTPMQPVYEPAPQYSPPPQQQVVNLGLSQSPVGTGNWGGIPRPRVPTTIRRRSGGGNKAGAIIGIVVAAIVGLAVVGSRSSSGSHPVAIPSIAISIPPLSVGSKGGPAVGSGGSASGGHAAPSRPAHRSGRTLDLNGNVSGERISVTFLRLVNNARPKDTFMDSPSSGKRLVAAQFRVRNIGNFIYVASATSAAHVVDSKGHTYGADFLFDNLREGKIFSGAINVATGHSAVGYIGFEVPKNAKIKKVEFSASPSGGDTGTWTFVRS